jgi:CAAX protease family protein
MSDDLRPDRADDVVRPRHDDDVPVLRPLRPADRDDDLQIEFVDSPPTVPRRDSGFGFWLAVVWCVLYVVLSQIVVGVVLLILLYAIFLYPEIRDKGLDAVLNPAWMDAWQKGPDGRLATLLLVAGTQLAGLLLSLALLRLWCGRPWKRKIALTRRPTLTHAALVLIGFPALIALSATVEEPIKRFVPSIQDILDALGADIKFEGQEILPQLIGPSPWALAIFVVAVCPGVCEEMFCRGFLAQGLSGRYRNWAVVLIVSFLFGCIHLDPQQGFGAMLLGAAIHAAYIATRSLMVAMFVHFANNAMGVIHYNHQLYPVLDPFERVFKEQPILFVASAALLFVAVCYALYQTRCKLVPAAAGMPVWEPPDPAGVELPPPQTGTVVAHDPLSPASVSLVLVGAIAFGAVLAAYA